MHVLRALDLNIDLDQYYCVLDFERVAADSALMAEVAAAGRSQAQLPSKWLGVWGGVS